MGGPCKVDGQVRKELDNFHQCRIELDGKIWPTAEHVFQASKCPGDPEQREKIRNAVSGMDSWQLGQTRTAGLRPDWEAVKVDVMYEANLAKFQQNQDLHDVLVSSSGPIEAQGGFFWKTWNEVLLERIREELRSENQRDAQVLAQRISAMTQYHAAATAKDQYQMDVVTQYASKRAVIPDLSGGSANAVIVAGAGSDLDGTYDLDLMVPESNGCPHYSNRRGNHLYFGVKKGKSAWVLDECFSPGEYTGAAFVELGKSGKLPEGKLTWQCFDGMRHVGRIVSIQTEVKR